MKTDGNKNLLDLAIIAWFISVQVRGKMMMFFVIFYGNISYHSFLKAHFASHFQRKQTSFAGTKPSKEKGTLVHKSSKLSYIDAVQ